jgi:hypothetical protein
VLLIIEVHTHRFRPALIWGNWLARHRFHLFFKRGTLLASFSETENEQDYYDLRNDDAGELNPLTLFLFEGRNVYRN